MSPSAQNREQKWVLHLREIQQTWTSYCVCSWPEVMCGNGMVSLSRNCIHRVEHTMAPQGMGSNRNRVLKVRREGLLSLPRQRLVHRAFLKSIKGLLRDQKLEWVVDLSD